MASAQKQLASSVLVSFSTLYASPQFEYPERRITLKSKGTDSPTPSVKIGRTSKRFAELGAKEDNLYFDSPVMSREHAEISVDWYHKKVFVKDLNSLHGTHLNNIRLRSGELHELSQDNILKFGMNIQRSSVTFPPCTVQVEWEWDPSPQSPKKMDNRPTFRVPEDSDSSDSDEGDEDESDIRATVEKMRKIEQHRTNRSFGPIPSIDLTEESPKPAIVANRSTVVTIVIDDDVPQVGGAEAVIPVPERAASDVANITSSSQPSSDAALDVDAPHDEEADVYDDPLRHQAFHRDPDSESDDSCAESPHYPDDLSSEGNSSVEEDICLSDSLSGSDSEDQSNDEQGLSDSDGEQEVSGDEEEEMEGPVAYDVNDDDDSVDEYESQVDEPTWDVSTSQEQQGAFTQPEAHSMFAPMSKSHVAADLRVFPSTVPSNISILCPPPQVLPPWTELPQQHAEEYKLPPLLNQPNPQPGALSGLLSAQPLDITSSHRAWQRACAPPVSLEENTWMPQTDGPSAEDLGQKTGKHEYFAAREHNKVKMQQQAPSQPSSEPTMPASAAKSTVCEARTSQVEAPKSTQVPQSAWMIPGNKFLNSPPPQVTARENSPEYDMTSAYQFQQSKLAAVTQPAINNTEPAAEEFVKSPKRKADDISTALPEEQLAEACAIASEPQTAEMTQSATTNEVVVLSSGSIAAETAKTAKTEQPPTKRLRFLPSWKGLGTFGAGLSAGGIMLGSMLAMSAPNL